MTGLKDAYRSGEENYLGKTGQVRMEFNVVTAPVRNTSMQIPTLLRLEHPYSIRSVRTHSTTWGIVKGVTEKTQAQSSYNRGQRREVTCFNCDKKGHMDRDCRGSKKNKGCDNPMDKEKMMKIFQEMMVKCNSKLEDFQ